MEKQYESKLDVIKTQEAITKVKQHFEKELLTRLNLIKVSAPLFIDSKTGLQDNLNGKERAVDFEVSGQYLEIVQSLAKWKRFALKQYGFEEGSGICTDMTAIRKDEKIDSIHSYLVDQWDWEKVISKEERNIDTLKAVVTAIYKAIRTTARYIKKEYPVFSYKLAKSVYFITAQELEDLYKDKSAKEREYLITKKYGTVFIIGIGDKLKSGKEHDFRSPDYDDWKLNGDLLIWHSKLGIPLEITSMGIRVDKESMISQVKKSMCEERLKQKYHKMVINEELPYTIGGGIGQSRLCMIKKKKMHIGEVQVGFWSKEELLKCQKMGIKVL